MFRFFESRVDPFVDHPQNDTPPQRLLPFMLQYVGPFRRLFVIAALLSVVVAGVELGLIWAMGWIVDILSGDPAQVWADHGAALIWLALAILLLRPVVQALDVLVLNNAILPNFGTLVRWRAHRHVLRQSVGWFEDDFAGRIANRIMQTPSSAVAAWQTKA